MIGRVCLLWMLLVAAPAAAQTVRTQTGEHADFTRVVLTIPANAGWTIGRTPQGYGVQIDGIDGFNLSQFFELIPRDRIAQAAVSDDGTLALTVPCDCHITAELGPVTILVLDIRDGPAPNESPFETALYPEVIQPNEEIMAPVEFAEVPTPQVLVERPKVELPLMVDVPAQSPLVRDDPFPTQTEMQTRAEENQRVSSLEIAVAESLSRATSQGLLELSDAFQVTVTTPQDVLDDDAAAMMPVLENEPERGEIRPGIVASTSVDLGLSGVFSAQNIAAEALTCWPDEMVDVSTWGTDDPFAQQLATHRAAITGEFDVVDPQAVENLAKLYLYFGFGREAIQTLAIDGSNSRARSALRIIAQIIDGDPVDQTLLTGQAICTGPVALWAVLAAEQNGDFANVDQQFIARQFKLLPHGLQVHLGPRLATRIVALDDPDIAETVLSRSVETHQSTLETAMVESEIALERGDLRTATQALTDVTSTQTRLTPKALIELINLKIQQDLPVSTETLAQAETLKFEFRESAELPELAEAVISAHLHSGAHKFAFDLLRDERDIVSADGFEALHDNIVARATDEADDATFLDILFARQFDSITPETQHASAERLLALGFPDRAMQLVSGTATATLMAERRYLRAEAAVAMDDFASAEAHLAGVNTERAATILSFGLDGVPLAGLTSDEAPPDPATTAWRNGDWQELVAGEDTLLRDISSMVLNDDLSEADPSAPLAGGRALVADASETRQTLVALINRFDAPLLDDLP